MNRCYLRFMLFAISGCILIFPTAGVSQGSNDPNQLYVSLKQIEDKFPVPTPQITVDAGTFYPHGNYDTPGKTLFIRPNWNNPRIKADGVNVVLRLEIDPSYTQDFRARVLWIQGGSNYAGDTLGKRINNPPIPPAVRPGNPPGKYLYLNIGGRTYPRVFTICLEVSSYDRKTQVALVIERPLLVGAGVFTVPVIPIAIVYEPPQDKNNRNTVTYTLAKSAGTTVRTSMTREDSLTVPITPQFSDYSGFQSKLNSLGSACSTANSVFPNKVTAVAGSLLKTFAEGLGRVSASQTKGTIVTKDHALSIYFAREVSLATSLHKGPGLGDRILTRRNARVAWLADNEGGITLYLLPGSIEKPFPVSMLQAELQPALANTPYPVLTSSKIKTVLDNKSQPNTTKSPAPTGGSGLSRDQIRALLELDPFVGRGPQASLPSPRFCYVDSYEPTWEPQSYTFTHVITNEDMNAKAQYVIKMEDQSPGWLSFLGLGVTEEKHVKTSVTHTGSTTVKTGQTVSTEVKFFAEVGETYCVEAYYDRVFGTFAFRSAPLSSDPALTGQATNEFGQPAAGQLVTLAIGGKTYSTRTDAQGKYTLRAASIPAGVGTLTIGNRRQPVELRKQEKPIRPGSLIIPDKPTRPTRK